MELDESVRIAYEAKEYSKVIILVEDNIKKTRTRLNEHTLQYYLKSLSFYGIYDKALKYLRQKAPKNYRLTKDKYKNIELIKEELSKGTISESILFDYFIFLIKTGEFENAYKVLNSITKLYSKYVDNFLLVILLLRCEKIKEAQEIIESADFNGNQLLKIGVTYFTTGQYELTKEMLEKARKKRFSKHYDDTYEKIYDIIDKHQHTGKYISMNYEYFKKNHELRGGDIIFVSDVDEHYKSIDQYALKRTYMIWKIEKDIIYAFPVTTKIPKDIRRFKIFRQNYLNFDSDRVVKEDIVMINKRNVQKVQERLTEEDYMSVLGNIYSGIIVSGNDEKKQESNLFMKEIYDSFHIENNSIIVAYDRKTKKAKNYLVVDNDEDYIYGVEVFVERNKCSPLNYKMIKIAKKEELLRVNSSVKLPEKNLNEIELYVKPKVKKK